MLESHLHCRGGSVCVCCVHRLEGSGSVSRCGVLLRASKNNSSGKQQHDDLVRWLRVCVPGSALPFRPPVVGRQWPSSGVFASRLQPHPSRTHTHSLIRRFLCLLDSSDRIGQFALLACVVCVCVWRGKALRKSRTWPNEK